MFLHLHVKVLCRYLFFANQNYFAVNVLGHGCMMCAVVNCLSLLCVCECLHCVNDVGDTQRGSRTHRHVQ